MSRRSTGWDGPRPRRPGLSEARARRDRAARRARAPARRADPVRLVKGAYWDGEVKRAQIDGPRRLSGLHHQGRRPTCPISPAHAICSRAGGAIYPAIRHAQRPHAGRRAADGASARARRTTNSSACTAWARRSTRRSSRQRRCASTRRSAGTRTCCPIWCGACWRTAPTPRFVHSFLDDDVSPDIVAADPLATLEANAAPPSALAAAAATLYGASRPQLDRAAISRSSARSRRALANARSAPSRGGPRRASRAIARRSRDRRRRSTRAFAAAWNARGGAERGRILRAMADALQKQRTIALIALLAREGGRNAAGLHRRSARGRRFLPLLRGRGRAPVRRPARAAGARRARPIISNCTGAASSSASARGISRWRSSPARSPPRSRPATPWSPSRPSRRR